jgi:hypothetical protein
MHNKVDACVRDRSGKPGEAFRQARCDSRSAGLVPDLQRIARPECVFALCAANEGHAQIKNQIEFTKTYSFIFYLKIKILSLCLSIRIISLMLSSHLIKPIKSFQIFLCPPSLFLMTTIIRVADNKS